MGRDGKILVTGGTGYLGSHAVVQLLQAGAEVVILDNICNSKPDVINRIQRIVGRRPEFINGDIRDRAILRDIFSSVKISLVMHFAGLKAVNDSIIDPLAYYDNNVLGTVILLEEMARAGVKQLVFSSSASVYGALTSDNYNCAGIREDFPLSPISPYGQSKLMVETILADIYRSDSSWAIALLRYFNPVGAHSSGLIGEDPCGTPNNLMPLIVQVAAGKQAKLKIFGGDYPTFDGTCIRDYIHVEDLVRGHLATIKLLQKPGLSTINLGTGRGYSVLEIVKAFEDVTDKNVPFEIVTRRPGDAPAYYADSSFAQKMLGWTATHDIEQMCHDAWCWYLNSVNK